MSRDEIVSAINSGYKVFNKYFYCQVLIDDIGLINISPLEYKNCFKSIKKGEEE